MLSESLTSIAHMEKMVFWIIAAIIVAILVLNRMFKGSKDKRQQYLGAIAKFLDGIVLPLEGYDNSYKIDFTYKDIDFSFTDIEDPGFQTPTYRGVLKAKTNSDLTLSFTESSRANFRTEATSIAEVLSPWTKNADKVRLPKELQDFVAFTNNTSKANILLADDQISKIFLKFKNIDSRGHPVMSLEILEGVLTLKFHPLGSSLHPNLFDLQNSSSAIEVHLEKMLVIINKINQLSSPEET